MRPGDLTAEAMAVRLLADTLAAEDLECAVDSETNFRECVELVLSEIRDAETMAEAIEARRKDLDARRWRHLARVERLRDVLVGAFATAGIKTLPLAEATITVSEQAPTAALTDEARIPLTYKSAPAPIDSVRHALIEASIELTVEGRTRLALKIDECAAALGSLYRPDKRAIAAALRAEEAVPGAELRNMPPRITIRTT